MGMMFYSCKTLTDVTALANWDVSNVTKMNMMFSWCKTLTDVTALANWDVSNVTDMGGMFFLSKITDISVLANWDVSNVTDMERMFYLCKSLSDISGLSNWNVSNVTNMDSLFDTCSALSSVSALANWDVSSVNDMNSMFRLCDSLTDISGLANWDVSNVTSFGLTFYGTKITNVDALKNWDIRNCEDFTDMFADCMMLVDISGLANWDMSGEKDLYGMFIRCSSLEDISPLANWDVSNVTNMMYLFDECVSIADASSLSVWNVNTSTTGAFKGCVLLEEHPSKYPTWYSAYRAPGTAASEVATASLMTLKNTKAISPMLLSNAPENGNARDVVFDNNDYSTVNAARYNADSGRFVADANGEAYYVFHLKNGAFIDIKDLNPEVQYEITEVGNSYLPSYTVTEGSEYTISDSGKKETPNSDLSTGKETLTAGSSISYLFTNKKDADHNVTITKKVDGDIASVTDQFDYKAFISGLTPGKEYNIKKTTAPVGNTEGTFDFSKYDVSGISYELTDELINTFAGYMHYDGYDKYYFDNDGNGLGITCNGERIDGFDRFYVERGSYTSVVFVNSSTNEKAGTYMSEEDVITAYSLRDPDTEEVAKTIDLSPYVRKDYMEIEEEDLRILDGAEFVNGDITFNCSVVNTEAGDKLQIVYTYVETAEGINKTETFVGDSFAIEGGSIYFVDSNTREFLCLFDYADQVSFSMKGTSETATFTADESGNAVLEWTMKANDAYEIMELPEGATYQVIEAGAEKYIASYEITDNNDADGVLDTVVKVRDGNFFRNKTLSTAKETVDLYEDVVITFTNTAPMPVLPSTGSNTALLLTLFGLAGIAGYGIYKTLRRKKRNNMAV